MTQTSMMAAAAPDTAEENLQGVRALLVCRLAWHQTFTLVAACLLKLTPPNFFLVAESLPICSALPPPL